VTGEGVVKQRNAVKRVAIGKKKMETGSCHERGHLIAKAPRNGHHKGETFNVCGRTTAKPAGLSCGPISDQTTTARSRSKRCTRANISACHVNRNAEPTAQAVGKMIGSMKSTPSVSPEDKHRVISEPSSGG